MSRRSASSPCLRQRKSPLVSFLTRLSLKNRALIALISVVAIVFGIIGAGVQSYTLRKTCLRLETCKIILHPARITCILQPLKWSCLSTLLWNYQKQCSQMIIRKSPLYIFSPVIYLLLLTRASLDPILKMTEFGGISFGALLNLAVIVFFFGGLLQTRGSISSSVIKLWAGFIAVGLISIIISPIPVTSFRSFVSVLTYFSVFSLAYTFVRSREDLESIIKLIILA